MPSRRVNARHGHFNYVDTKYPLDNSKCNRLHSGHFALDEETRWLT